MRHRHPVHRTVEKTARHRWGVTTVAGRARLKAIGCNAKRYCTLPRFGPESTQLDRSGAERTFVRPALRFRSPPVAAAGLSFQLRRAAQPFPTGHAPHQVEPPVRTERGWPCRSGGSRGKGRAGRPPEARTAACARCGCLRLPRGSIRPRLGQPLAESTG